jgi:L-iditol 2-dehydrogenase
MHAIRRVSFKSKKDRILVIGLGTIGLCVCMLLSVLGYENLYAVGNKQYQQGMFEAAGGQKNRYHEYTKISDSEEYDVVFECVGKNSAIRYAIETAGVGGQVVFVGNPAEDIIFPKEEYWKILRRQLRISGSWNSSFLGFSDKDAAQDDWNRVLSLVSEKKIHPEKLISHVLDFSGLPEGLELMRNRTMPSTKVMLIRGE